ncbi:MAG TPA: PilZ domain-containing protein [Pyrinomonadaceae bacterium]|nr:PilZ domain-containing protein [Pyrinomonadaceae bacterium]
MSTTQTSTASGFERRRFPRYFVNTGLTLAIEDATLRESIGLGEPDDLSVGGVRVRNLPDCPNVRVGDRLLMLLVDCEEALSVKGEVVHHATPDTFGVEFNELSAYDRVAVSAIIDRLHGFPGKL